MKTTLLACASALVITLTGAALAAPPADTVATLKVYQRTNASIQAVTEEAIERFNKRYPNVKVETQWVPLGSWPEYIGAFLNQAASGDVPDIFQVAIEGHSNVVEKGLMRPLDELIANDASAKAVMEDIEPNLLASMARATGGKLHFFPISWNNVITFYNKDMFDEAGVEYPKADWTWQDLPRPPRPSPSAMPMAMSASMATTCRCRVS